jgi:predicted nucleotidyltransferase
MVYFQANAESPIFSDLQGLLIKTAGVVDILADVLKPLAAKVQVAFVYGSMASGREQNNSDVDLMLVGMLAPAELALPLRRARELLGRDINPSVYTPAEFRKKRADQDHFLTRVLDKPKLFVLGNRNELEKITG